MKNETKCETNNKSKSEKIIKNPPFRGAATAIITPFKNGKPDFYAFERLVEFQISEGVDAIVFCGTTGEASTLSEDEWRECVSFAVSTVNGRVKVIIGCGSNNTANAENKSAFAEKSGADCILSVTPYYNKASISGLITHYKRIAASVSIPVILYNVPSRTGVDIPFEAYQKLANVENICGVKEASGNVSRAAQIISLLGDSMPLYSGSDELNLPLMALGARGVISVTSNILPREITALCRMCEREEYKKAAKLSAALYPLTSALFCEVNPIPVKTALYEMGFCREEFRLPLCRISPENRQRLTRELEKRVKLKN